METTIFLAQIIGPILILRGLSIVFGKDHFLSMIKRLEADVESVCFAMMSVSLFAAFFCLLLVHNDWSSLPAGLITFIAWAGAIKGALLIVFPKESIKRAQALCSHGYLNVVMVVCFVVGAYLTWFGFGS